MSRIYNVGIRAFGESDYREKGLCYEGNMHSWIDKAKAAANAAATNFFVDFFPVSHTFEVTSEGKHHMITKPTIIDPALAAQFEGS